MKSSLSKALVLSKLSESLFNTAIIRGSTFHRAKKVVADTFGTAFSGARTHTFQLAIEKNEIFFGNGVFATWGNQNTNSLFGSVFYNTLSIASTDFDEGHRKAAGHPASAVVPVALILGKHLKRNADQILRAVIIGYETGTRFSWARQPETIQTYSSGRWAAIASAATSACLLGLDTLQTMHALSLAAALSPSMLGGSIDVSTGSMAKEGIPWASVTGVQAAYLASTGFVGPYLFAEDPDKYDHEKLLDGLGDEWLINSNYFKPYACCRWLHTAIKCVLDIKEKYNLKPEEISKVEVQTFSRAIGLVESLQPQNPIQAQFHLPYTLACALVFGKVLPEHFSSEAIGNKLCLKLIKKIKLTENRAFSKRFPLELPSKVIIQTAEGQTFEKESSIAPWEASNPPSDEELKQKFLEQTGENGAHLWKAIFEEDFDALI